ncbi:alpha-1,4-glucan:maltose-1-phosphate maltosyltransferase [Actinomycetota bacterium]|nr:alpha-1,4-glucan:maltose-1-phosphate maltosyltransferase [Actinomycetota bacterium]
MAKHAVKKSEDEVTVVGNLVGRFPVINASPVFEGGRFAPKVIVDEVFPVDAKIFREGHDKLGATAVVVALDGTEKRFGMVPVGYAGDDNWNGLVQAPSTPGLTEFYIEAWSNPYQTWEHNAWIKVPQGQDVDLMLEEGARIFDKWKNTEGLTTADKEVLDSTAQILRDGTTVPDQKMQAASNPRVHEIFARVPYRELVSHSERYPLEVQRSLSSFCAWYQFFPRSEGAKRAKDGTITPGTFSTASKRLPMVKEMGFDVIYLPPIHPIGSAFKKGKNNTLDAKPEDVGSPWAVGNQNGGHDTVNPDLGSMTTFKNFVKKAKELDLEVSLDIALQASPDHPWVKEHPEWFTVRADGTIAYAENPPKKYQDIYPINFDNDPEGIVKEVLRTLRIWIDAGVTVMRIDNPHTKPVWFWQYVIADIKRTNPEVIWLAEAFTLPAMMKTLGAVGYDQSHSYFLWRNTKQELSEFLGQISGNDGFWYRATLWPTTPDNLTDYLASAGASGHAVRAVLAAMGSPTWGIYAGYEFVENVQRTNPDGSKAGEHIDSEKYEIKVRDWKNVDKFGIKPLLTKLNEIRRSHQCTQNIHSLQIQATSNDNILAFSRHIPGQFTKDGKDDTIVVVVNLDPHNVQKGMVYLDWGALNIEGGFKAVDELSGREYHLGTEFFVDIAPVIGVAHIFKVVR